MRKCIDIKKGTLAAALMFFLLCAAQARAQYLLRTSPFFSGSTQTLVLYVSQWDQYNITLNANTPIQFSVPVISGAIFFRVHVCENALGGFTPTFSATATGGSAPAVAAFVSVLATTAANQCSIEWWTYRQSENKLVLENVTPVSFQNVATGIYNILAYGAVASTASAMCTGTVGQSQISCTGTGDFRPGQHITFNHAGAPAGVAAPLDTVNNVKWLLPAVNNDTPDNSGSTTGTYLIGGLDGRGGIQMAGAAISNATGPAALSFNSFDKNSFTPAAGGSGTVICGCYGASCPTLSLIAVVPQNQAFYYDMGTALTGIEFGTSPDSSTLCTQNATFADNDNDVVASVSNGLPTALVSPLVVSVTTPQPLFHDNSVAINAAIAAACSTGGEIYAPAGTYTLGQTVVTPNVGINCKGIQFVGAGDGVQARGTTLEWWGPLGGVAFKVYCVADSKFMDFSIDDQGGATPEYGLQSSNVGCIANNNNNLDFSGVSIGESGYGLYVSDAVNNSPLTFHQFKIFNGGIANFTFNNGQSKNNTFWGPIEAKRLYGLYQLNGGTQVFFGRQGVGWIQEWIANPANIADFGGESETPARWLVTGGPTSVAATIGFYNVQLTQNINFLPTDGIAFSDNFNSPLILIGDNFLGGGLPQPAWKIYANEVAYNGSPAVVSLANGYPVMTPFAGVSSGNTVTSHGDRGSATAGVTAALPEIAGTQNYYNGTGTSAIPACSSIYARQTYCVSDETTACTAAGVYAPGGTNKCVVQCNSAGNNWIVVGTSCY